jgi:hypothetical protein
MKLHAATRVVPLVLTLALAGNGCGDVRDDGDDDLSRLEELPQDVAAQLKPVPNTNLLVSQPTGSAAPLQCGAPSNTRRPCASQFEHRIFALYPVTICYPPEFPTDGILVDQKPTGSAPIPPHPPTRTFRLSSRGGTSPVRPLRCVVKTGPFGISIIETEDCSRTVKNHFAVDRLVPCEGCPPLEWCGELKDNPPPLQLIDQPSTIPLKQTDCDPTDLNVCDTGLEPPGTPPPGQ